MPKNVRGKRNVSKRIIVYCEGDTEDHYLTGLKKWLRDNYPAVKIAIKQECVAGGGYKSFLKALDKEPDSNCIARIVLLDLDRFAKHEEEHEPFQKLVEYCNRTKASRVPCILVGSYEKFEYALCCHDPDYSGSDVSAFLKKQWGYSSLDKCKADQKIWEKAHSGNRSHDQAIAHLEKRPKAIVNNLRINKSSYGIELKEVCFDENELTGYGANLKDLFFIVGAI